MAPGSDLLVEASSLPAEGPQNCQDIFVGDDFVRHAAGAQEFPFDMNLVAVPRIGTCHEPPGVEENMPPNFLLPESIVKGDGGGPMIDLGQTRGKLLVLTLGITSIVEKGV
jgi:hypothetical protein